MVVTVRRRDGSTTDTTFGPRYTRGGTFAAGGFGFGGTDTCETDEWTAGQGPPAIIMNPAAAVEPFTIAHEMGHFVEYAVRRPLLPFTGATSPSFSGSSPAGMRTWRPSTPRFREAAMSPATPPVTA